MKKPKGFLFKLAWMFFFIILFANLVDFFSQIKYQLTFRSLPLQIERNNQLTSTDDGLTALMADKDIIGIDTLSVDNFKRLLKKNTQGRISFDSQTERDEKVLLDRLTAKDSLEIIFRDINTNEITTDFIFPEKKVNRTVLFTLMFNLFMLLLIFFNCFLLLKFSDIWENVLIVFFLLFFATPTLQVAHPILKISSCLSASLLGVLFYHFIMIKTELKFRIVILYIAAILLATLTCLFFFITGVDLVIVLYAWSLLLIFLAMLRIRRKYQDTGSIVFRRLLNSFKGLFLTIFSIAGLLLFYSLLSVYIGEHQFLLMFNLQTIIYSVLILVCTLGFLLGIFWFFGSFTWGLLTGTVLDIKIRSTIIYTFVGIVFVTFFGLIDYSLGELLQKLFGNFIGSEFIAGIPAAIGLIVFFNPIRNRVESFVDSRLNTSDLDFLEKTGIFTESFTGESIIEGFEGYICENLMQLLPITKVAIVSFDREMNRFKFNEIRGSDVEENSPVEDVHGILTSDQVWKNYINNENPSEIASFSLILPIIFETDNKWFLALGRKKDRSVYSRNDEKALIKLTERIKLSLKFILAYDEIINNRYLHIINEKNKIIADLRNEIEAMKPADTKPVSDYDN